jgi:hypothetical protein
MQRHNNLTENQEPEQPDMTHEAGDVPLTEREDTHIRSECVSQDGEALTWDSATALFRYAQEVAQNDSALLDSETQTSDIPYSIGADEKELERIQVVSEGFRQQNQLAYTYEITLSGVPFTGSGYMAPVDYLNDLNASWDAVKQKIYDNCSGSDYQYVKVYDAMSNGYTCLRLIVQTSDSLSDGGESLLEAHVDNSSVATESLHDPQRHVRMKRSVHLHDLVSQNLSCFSASRDSSWMSDGFHSLLWAAQEDRFNYSASAEEYLD